MIDYSVIKNEQLRHLVLLSESIQSQSEEAIQALIQRIAQLPEEGQNIMILNLEDEQKQIVAAKRLKGITPEMEIDQLSLSNQKVLAAQRYLNTAIREDVEKEEREESEDAAYKLIKAI